jgi:hypothetical protein
MLSKETEERIDHFLDDDLDLDVVVLNGEVSELVTLLDCTMQEVRTLRVAGARLRERVLTASANLQVASDVIKEAGL